MQALFLLVPPVLFAATLYMVYSRVVRAVHGEAHSLISLRWCTRIFVIGDMLCLNIQSSGAGLLGNPKLIKYGDTIIIFGLGLQVLIFALFMYTCLRFHLRFRTQGGKSEVPWQAVLGMLYVTSVIISVRNVFRLVEFVMGKDSYLFENEWPAYVFDGVLMLFVMLVFYIWYPDQLRNGGGGTRESMIELTSDGAGEEERPGMGKGAEPAVFV
jgi:hypothetical protein